MKKKREIPPIGAGSMADVAFLLLVFFLVATTIQTDTGLNVKLPPWVDEPVVLQQEDRNVLSVLVSSENKLMIENEEAKLSDLKMRTERLILQEAESPKKAIVSLQNDNGTSYDMYVSVYNEIKAAYNQIWNDASLKKYGQNYKDLKKTAQRDIRAQFPLVISEAEPTDFALNE